MNRHVGDWQATSAILAGNAFPDEATRSILLTLGEDTYELVAGGRPDRGTSVTDRNHDPHRVTITGTEGPNAGKTYLAIMDFPDEDVMRVAYDLSGRSFPASFESTAENRLFVVTYVRL